MYVLVGADSLIEQHVRAEARYNSEPFRVLEEEWVAKSEKNFPHPKRITFRGHGGFRRDGNQVVPVFGADNEIGATRGSRNYTPREFYLLLKKKFKEEPQLKEVEILDFIGCNIGFDKNNNSWLSQFTKLIVNDPDFSKVKSIHGPILAGQGDTDTTERVLVFRTGKFPNPIESRKYTREQYTQLEALYDERDRLKKNSDEYTALQEKIINVKREIRIKQGDIKIHKARFNKQERDFKESPQFQELQEELRQIESQPGFEGETPEQLDARILKNLSEEGKKTYQRWKEKKRNAEIHLKILENRISPDETTLAQLEAERARYSNNYAEELAIQQRDNQVQINSAQAQGVNLQSKNSARELAIASPFYNLVDLRNKSSLNSRARSSQSENHSATTRQQRIPRKRSIGDVVDENVTSEDVASEGSKRATKKPRWQREENHASAESMDWSATEESSTGDSKNKWDSTQFNSPETLSEHHARTEKKAQDSEKPAEENDEDREQSNLNSPKF